jgi:uncharacterized RDD family membrane protein YckC
MENRNAKVELAPAGYVSRFLSGIIDGLAYAIVSGVLLCLVVYPLHQEIFQEFFAIIQSGYYDTTFARDLTLSSEKLEYNQEQFNKYIASVSWVGLLLWCASGIFYEPISTKILGETVGRKIMNIKIVNLDGTDISYLKRCFRAFYKQCISGYFGILYLLFLPTYYNPRKRLPHDFGIGTKVISIEEEMKPSDRIEQKSDE